MRLRSKIFLLLTVPVALAAAGCGSEGEGIPRDEAAQLDDQLTTLEEQIDADDCAGADATLTAIANSVKDLGGGVDRGIRTTLRELVENLDALYVLECANQPEPTTTTPTPTTTTTTETTDETTTDPTDETTTDPTDEEPPEDGDGDGGNGGGGDEDDEGTGGTGPGSGGVG